MMRQVHQDKVVSGDNSNWRRGRGKNGCGNQIKSYPSTSAIDAL